MRFNIYIKFILLCILSILLYIFKYMFILIKTFSNSNFVYIIMSLLIFLQFRAIPGLYFLSFNWYVTSKLIRILEKSSISRGIKFLFAMVNFLDLLVRSICSRCKMADVSFPARVIIDRNVTVLTYIAGIMIAFS